MQPGSLVALHKTRGLFQSNFTLSLLKDSREFKVRVISVSLILLWIAIFDLLRYAVEPGDFCQAWGPLRWLLWAHVQLRWFTNKGQGRRWVEEGDKEKEMKWLGQRATAMPRAEPTFPHNQTILLPSLSAAAATTVMGHVSLDLRFPAGSLHDRQPSRFYGIFFSKVGII